MWLQMMHQSFVTTAPTGPVNSGNFIFSRCIATVNVLYCGAIFAVKTLPKAETTITQILAGKCKNSPWHSNMESKPRVDDAEVKTWC